MAKVWLNLYNRPPTHVGVGGRTVNDQHVVKGVYPGSGFFASEAVAASARQAVLAPTDRWDQTVVFIACVEVEVPDGLVVENG